MFFLNPQSSTSFFPPSRPSSQNVLLSRVTGLTSSFLVVGEKFSSTVNYPTTVPTRLLQLSGFDNPAELLNRNTRVVRCVDPQDKHVKRDIFCKKNNLQFRIIVFQQRCNFSI